MVTTRCRGRYGGGFLNHCDCPDCRTRAELRGDCINAIEAVHRAHTRNSGEQAVATLEARRDRTCDRWEAWEAGGAEQAAGETEVGRDGA